MVAVHLELVCSCDYSSDRHVRVQGRLTFASVLRISRMMVLHTVTAGRHGSAPRAWHRLTIFGCLEVKRLASLTCVQECKSDVPQDTTLSCLVWLEILPVSSLFVMLESKLRCLYILHFFKHFAGSSCRAWTRRLAHELGPGFDQDLTVLRMWVREAERLLTEYEMEWLRNHLMNISFAETVDRDVVHVSSKQCRA